MATNKRFLYLNISKSYWNYAMPYMTPTYPENIRLLGPSSWEEIDSQQTNRQTDRPREFNPPSSHMHISSPLILLISDTQASLASLARLGQLTVMQ